MIERPCPWVQATARPSSARTKRSAGAAGPVALPGAFQMSQGLQLPQAFPDSIWVLEGTRL